MLWNGDNILKHIFRCIFISDKSCCFQAPRLWKQWFLSSEERPGTPARKTKSFFSLDWQRRFVSPQQVMDLKATHCWEKEGFPKFLSLPSMGPACWGRSRSFTVTLGWGNLGMWSPGNRCHLARQGNATLLGWDVPEGEARDPWSPSACRHGAPVPASGFTRCLLANT